MQLLADGALETEMQSLLSHLMESPVVLVLTIVALGLFAHFVWQYGYRGWMLRQALKATALQLDALKAAPRSELRRELGAVFKGTAAEHAWREFDDTLHEQIELRDGQRVVRDVRATVPAGAFINLETVVDPRIGAEYFRHLPGLFTGLGIVGTFSGLIQGLLGFKPDVDTEALKGGLAALFGHVQGAFVFSAFAIGVAMLVTLVEKWLYSSCTKWLGEITVRLDSMFRAGVGEEYLSGLLQTSQDNATQTRQLKESMVDDLKVLLTNLTERQIQATQQLSLDIGRQIEGTLKEPLASLADTVRQASGQQTTAATHVLENLMSAFVAEMRQTLGGQLGDLSHLMRQSAESMAQVEAAMRSLVGDMQRASSESTTAMQATVRDLIQSLAEQQQKQASAIGTSTARVIEQVAGTVAHLAQQQDAMTQRTQAAMGALTSAMDGRLEALASSQQASTEATSLAIASLGRVSDEAVTGMTAGAQAVRSAVEAVQSVTERLAALTSQFGALQTTFVQSTQQVGQASGVLGAASQALATATNTLGGTATRFEAVAAAASTEREIRAALLNDLKAMSQQSREVGSSLAGLSDEVRGHLASNIEVFGSEVSKVLSRHLNDYQKQLGSAIDMLRSALEELAVVAVDARR